MTRHICQYCRVRLGLVDSAGQQCSGPAPCSSLLLALHHLLLLLLLLLLPGTACCCRHRMLLSCAWLDATSTLLLSTAHLWHLWHHNYMLLAL